MRYIFVLILFLSFLLSDELAVKLKNLINNKRTKSVEILKYDPFFTKKELKRKEIKKREVLHQKRVTKKRYLKLVAIFGDRAFINGKWVCKNGIIEGYRLKKILGDSVVLVKKGRRITLGFKRGVEILKVRDR